MQRSTRTRAGVEGLLLYVGSRLNLTEAADLGAGLDGLVLSGRSAYSRGTRLREAGFAGTLLLDEASYGKEERGAEQLSLEIGIDELSVQMNLGVGCLLVPTEKYFEGGDQAGLADALSQASARCQSRDPETTAIVVALAASWLTDHLSQLLRCLRNTSHPAALVLGDQNDPLARKGAVEGLVEVVTQIPGTSLLRSDFGALGALAFGAPLGAVGLTTSHRHAVPPGAFAGGRRGSRSLRVVHPEGLTFFSADILQRARQVDPECHCRECRGAPLHRFVDENLRREANRHNVAVWRRVADDVLCERPEHRGSAWRAMCRKAVEWERDFQARARTDALRVDTQIVRWADLKL